MRSQISRLMITLTASCLLLVSCVTGKTPEIPPSPIPTTTQAPTPTETPTAVPEDTPSPTPTQPHKAVFVISWDAGGADIVYDLMADGALPHFTLLAESGLRAEYAQTVDPSMTTAAQNSISTGSYPSRTGIVSNSFHNPNDSFYWYRRGFDELLDQAEPVWVTASRAGLKTAAVFFVGGSPQHPGQTADYTVGYGIQDAYSRQEHIPLSPVDEVWQGEVPLSFSPPYEGSYTIREVARLYLYVLDSSDDNVSNYDTVILNTERLIDSNSPQLTVGDWGQLVLMPTKYAGADFLIQEIEQADIPSQVTLFYSGVYHNTAAPRELLEELNREFGYFPSGADYYALEHGWITPEDNLYLLERASLWMAEVASWVYATYRPDLLFTWQDGFDAAGHSYLLQEPRQFDYSPEKVEQYAAYYQHSAQVADQALEIMLNSINLEETTVMMVADHGMAPLHTRVYVNTILEHAGLLTLDGRDYVVVDETKAFAVASGGAVNVYINLQGHEKEGSVSTEEYSQLQDEVIALLSTLNDPETGDPVFQRVLRQDELPEIHLDHLNAGDVFAQAYPGYHLDGWRGNKNVFEAADFYGQHGYDSSLPEMYAIFIAAGAGIPGQGQVIPPVQVVDYAPTIAAILGFDPAPTVDGNPIPALMGGR